MECARSSSKTLVTETGPNDLRRATDGTRWTDQQMLLHILFEYLIVRNLLGLVDPLQQAAHAGIGQVVASRPRRRLMPRGSGWPGPVP
jgi:hypothetical protein